MNLTTEGLPQKFRKKALSLLTHEPIWAAQLRERLDESMILGARQLVEQMRGRSLGDGLHPFEFKVFSQFGDDGIIQKLVQYLEISEQTFVEFGVESYREANTRLLLLKDNWRGLVMDGSAQHMNALRNESLYWRHDLTAVAAFITRENINQLITENGFAGDLGLLSVDIDGNDYWVWERLDCVSPVIVVAEYNAVFGAERAISVPYDPRFVRTAAHYSNLYWGCSLGALAHLASKKGYALIGCNSNGNNAYFVQTSRMKGLKELSVQEAFVRSKFREARDQGGHLTFVSGAHRSQVIQGLPLVDVTTGNTERF